MPDLASPFAAGHTGFMQARPDAYFLTPHYEGWQCVLVRLDAVDEDELAGRIEDAWAYIDAKRPRLPWSENFTRPVTLANKVSSEPMPTLTPGLILVPRWRMMIDPPVISWPANAFTPSRCAFESRPFVELPPPFLCAITRSPSKVDLPPIWRRCR